MRRQSISSNHFLLPAIVCCASIFTWKPASAEEVAPYTARVLVSGSAAHSGPGENYYATDTLAQGETVEVYRAMPNGWLAIRPPNDSFSWVCERDIDVRLGLGEVKNDNVASRIGTRLDNQRNAAQVRLKKGEVLEIVGEETTEGVTWYKIAPPAGEFRWIHASKVERMGPLATSENDNVDLNVIPASATSDAAPASGDKSNANAASPPATESVTAATKQWQAAGAGTTPETMAAPPLAPTTSSPPAGSSQAPAVAARPSASTTAPITPLAEGSPASTVPASSIGSVLSAGTNATLAEHLTAIDVRLSRMAAGPPQLWNTELLQDGDVAQLMAMAKTPAERDAVRITTEKINRFADIARRYQQTTPSSSPSAQPTGGELAASSPAASPAGKYDATGILRPVVSKRPGAPQFALVDDRGQVISFVTATPDLNLQPYLGRRIGVVGNRGYIPEFGRAHVTASRVQPLMR